MGKKSKRKRERTSKPKLKLPGEEGKDSPPVMQTEHGPTERQGEGSNGSGSSSSVSHSSRSASPREEIVEEKVGTQKEGGTAGVEGGHVQSIDQQVEEGGSTDQQVKEGGSTDQQLEEGGSTDQQLEEGGSTDQQVEEGGSTDQQLEEGGSTDQQLEEGGSTDQQLEEGGSTDQQLEEGGSTDQQLEEGGSTDQQLEEGGSTDQQLEEGGSTDQQLEEGGSTDQQLEEDGSTDQQLEESGIIDQQVEKGGNIDQQLEEDGNIDEEVEESGNIDQQLDEVASKSNLSVLNVKSILHHVLKDRRVLAMVQRRVAEEEGRELSSEWQEDIVTYEPKLTRSHVRQAVASSVARGAVSPEKIASLTRSSITPTKAGSSKKQASHPLLDVTFSEESSDEEYNPATDMSEGESEGEESEEGEWRDTSLCDLEGPHIEEKQEDRTQSTTSVPAESPSSVPQDVPLVSQPMDTTATEAHMSSGSPPLSTAPELSTGPQIGPHSSTSQPVLSSTVTQTSHTLTSTTEASAADVCTLTTANGPSLSATQTTMIPTPALLSTVQPPVSQPPISQPPISQPPISQPPVSQPPVSQPPVSQPPLSQPPVSQPPVSQPPISQPPVSQPPVSQPPVSQPPLSQPPVSQPSVSESEDLVVQEAAALLASLSDTILSPMKFHMSQAQEDANQPFTSKEEDEDLIATRTRSKHPLTDTSISAIEASFIPPDVEDPPTPMELDDDELEWQQWLHDLMNPSDLPAGTSVGDRGDTAGSHDVSVEAGEGGEEVDDGDDVEYIYPADQQPEEEKEELRNDRAVKIPQKEVDDLLNELLNPADDGLGGLLLSDDGIDLTSAYLLESLGLQPPLLMQTSGPGTPQKASGPSGTETSSGPSAGDKQEGCLLSKDQTVQAWTQLQQHFQLLMQTFVLSRFEPSLVFLSQISAQAIEEIAKWCDEATEGKNSPVWYIPDLEEARELVQRLDPNTQSVELVPATGNPPRIPEVAQDIIINQPVFWKYPKLLPGIGFTALTKDNASGSKYFTTEEDYLLVLGMNHYGLSSWKLIQENILPTKSIKQLQLRVKNQCSKRTGDNVVKHYKKTKEVKIPYKDNGEEKVPDLPQWILHYHKKRQDKEKLQEKLREKEANDSSKMAKLLDGVLKPSTKPVALKAKVPGMPTGVSNASGEAAVVSDNAQGSSGSKRNLTSRLQEAESEAKRLCLDHKENGDRLSGTSTVESPSQGSRGRQKGGKRGRKRGQPGRKAQQTPSTSPLTTNLGSSNCVTPGNVPQPLNGVGAGRLSTSASPLKHISNPKGDMEQLLWAAGLEACDPAARYAYNYLNEVKATLLDSKQGTYEKFLKTLMDAKRHSWKPSKLFHRVQQILQPWPHLIKLFTEFMEPQDCLEAQVMADKYELESVKTFVETLQMKFASAPLQLEDVIRRLKELNTPNVTREKVQSSLLPLIDAHEQLVAELKRILYQLAPPPRREEVYEEITIGSDCEKEPDEFEEVVLPESPPVRVEGKKKSLKHREEMAPTKSPQIQPNSVENVVSMNNSQKILEDKSRNQFESVNVAKSSEGTPGSHAVTTLDNPKDSSQTGGGTSLVQTATETSLNLAPSRDSLPLEKTLEVTTMKQYEKNGTRGDVESGSVNNMADISLKGSQTLWTREEDRVVLQCSLNQQTGSSLDALRSVAKQLNRTETEVQQRYKQLLVLFQSSYSDVPPP